MDSTPSPAAEPNNAVAAAADERLKHAYQQIASADEQLARVTERLSKMERDDAHKAAGLSGRRPSRGGPVLRGLTGLLLAGCIIGGAFLSQSSSGGEARLLINRWVSPVFATSVPVGRARPDVSPSPVQVAAADATDLPTSSPAQQVAPVAAASSPELTEQLQTITRNIANLDQKIEQLRAAQEELAIQMDRDTARAIGELKSSQEQLTRLMAKPTEPNPRPKPPSVTSSVPSSAARQVAATIRQPTPTHGSTQARAPSPTRSPPQQP